MKVRLIGAGAVGSVVAWKLYGNCDFALIVDHSRHERYSNGLVVNGNTIDFSLVEPKDGDEADLVIFAVKNFQLDEAMDEAAPFIGRRTAILPLLNGIEAEGRLAERFGAEKVLYGFITDLSSTHSGLETVCFSDGGLIVFAEGDNRRTERVEEISRLFTASGQRHKVAEDIKHQKWWKFLLNTCFNTLSAILLADNLAISENLDFIRACRLIAREVQSVALAEGVSLTQDDVEGVIRRFTSHKDHGKTSMLQDVLAQRKTENMYFAGAVCRMGRKHGIPTPYCEFISILLEARRHVQSVQ
ncbi:MAG: 2-dehydropantoate 2-reductase [Candidatus Ornithospirochaeta sp.]|nr:2-dehydropantoate 2-reductase [Candidatus Ornithospirochaeta sp.]